VTTETLDIVEVWLPVLDDSVMVCGHKPVVAVGVCTGADGSIMSLHYGLEVEACAVP
jgi:hypothetical protein